MPYTDIFLVALVVITKVEEVLLVVVHQDTTVIVGLQAI